MTQEKKTIPTLSYDNPLVREFVIIETVFTEKFPDKAIIKYITREKVGNDWKDVVKSQFIDNPQHIDYTGCKLKFTTEIVG